ncbi:MAG: hypothetical protein ACI83H_001751 [Glaciecola sp.]|jgi:hypothetical protein
MKTWKKIGLGLLFIIVIFGVWFYPKTNTVIFKLSANPKYHDTSYVPSSDYASLELYKTIENQFN